jgi:putative peptide zinc metalloprotease protein
MVSDESLFSPDWFRVSGLVLKLRPTLRIGRQMLGGEPWYVYRNDANGRQLRLNAVAHRFAGRLDGRLSVQVLWGQLLDEAGDDTPSQDEIVALIQQLADAGTVTADQGMHLDRLSRRESARRRSRRLAAVNPLSFRVRLLDPGPLLDRSHRFAAPLFTGGALVLYALAIVVALVAAFEHRGELSAWARQHMPTPGFALAMWLVYPPLKACHELAHAYAVRIWGGQVREMGVSLMLGVPVPFVDASAAAMFASRGRRVAVSLAGIVAELLLAAAALWVWLSVGDGWLRSAAFAVMLIGTVSTLLVNGNPLMRYDAYFAMSDALDLPNLAERSGRTWKALARRMVAGERGADMPPGPAADRPWLIGWGLASWVYRVVVFCWLATWLAEWSRPLAFAVLAWGGWLTVGRAAWQAAVYAWQARWRHERPLRAIGGIAGSAAAFAAALALVPLPDATVLPGVVMPADAARMRAAEPGRVVEVLVRAGEPVVADTPLLRMENVALETERVQLQSMHDAQASERMRALESDRVASVAAGDELERTRARIAEVERRIDALVLRSATDGVVAFVDADGPLGRHVRQGEVLVYVLQPGSMRIQALARDDHARRLREDGGIALARLAERPGETLVLRLATETPQATRVLPGAALGDRAGGPIPTDPADTDGMQAIESWFQVEFVPDAPLARIGASAAVRVSHAPRPAAAQLGDTLRRLFLRRLEG